jgi:hypothetical protein
MKVLVFGLENENSLLSRLRKKFPAIGFKKQNLKDDLEQEGRDLVVLDTINGFDQVILVDELSSLSPGRINASDTLMTLRILLRIGSLDSVRVIAVPPGYPEDVAFDEICAIISGFPGS